MRSVSVFFLLVLTLIISCKNRNNQNTSNIDIALNNIIDTVQNDSNMVFLCSDFNDDSIIIFVDNKVAYNKKIKTDERSGLADFIYLQKNPGLFRVKIFKDTIPKSDTEYFFNENAKYYLIYFSNNIISVNSSNKAPTFH